MSEIVLETKNLGIAFGGLKAVENLNIRIEEKQIYGLIGPNGAGKTTAFNMLTAFISRRRAPSGCAERTSRGFPRFKSIAREWPVPFRISACLIT